MSGGEAYPDPDELGWPDPGTASDPATALYNARLEVRKKRVDAEIARARSEVDNDLAQSLEVQKGILEVAKASIERARSSGETVQKAASAIAVIYAAALSVAFSVASRPLPPRGILPGIFLGLAIVLSTTYLAYLTTPGSRSPLPHPLPPGQAAQIARARWFVLWTRGSSLRRSYWLRASVFSLGIGLVFLPTPFLGTSPEPSAANTTTATPWPAFPEVPGDPRLREILYQAQVAETAAQRAAKAPSGDDDNDIFIIMGGLVLGLAIVFVGPRLVERFQPTERTGR